MTRTSAALTALLSTVALGQTAAAPPAFDLADVHPSARVTNPYMRGGVLRGGRYDVRTASLLDLISTAYGLDSDKIQGGPSWLDTDRFDIAAKAPASTPPETVKLMLQTLLADRFALKVHKDTKSLPAYALSMGKGKHKLKASDGSASSNCQGQPQPPPQTGSPRYNVVACRNQTLDQLGQDLHDMAGAYLPSPVVNQTGLPGTWDFDLKWSPRHRRWRGFRPQRRDLPCRGHQPAARPENGNEEASHASVGDRSHRRRTHRQLILQVCAPRPVSRSDRLKACGAGSPDSLRRVP